jgi:tRNA-modifying protein YgfZ
MSLSDTSSFDLEYQALRAGRAVHELAGWSSVSVRGADRQSFLQNLCTNDVKQLAPGASCEAFFTNVKGHIVGHGVISCRNDELVIIGAPGQGSRLAKHLDRYVIREDVTLRDSTAERRYLLVAGEPSGLSHPFVPWNIIGRSDSAIIELVPNDSADSLQKLQAEGFILVGTQAFESARIEGAMPMYGVDFDEHNLPQEIGRDREAISFTKGCYLGQETVARIDALGHVNQKLVLIRFASGGVPDRETEISFNGRHVGKVTSAANSPKYGAPIALAMLRRDANALGTQLDSSFGPCEVIAD